MPDYRKMYLHLFNAVTDALRHMAKISTAAEILRNAQIECEEIYIGTAQSNDLLAQKTAGAAETNR